MKCEQQTREIWTFNNRCRLLLGGTIITASVYFIFKYLLVLLWPFLLGYLIAKLIEKPVKVLEKFFWKKRIAAATCIVLILSACVIGVGIYIAYIIFREIKTFIVNYDYCVIVVKQCVARICFNIDGWLGLYDGCCIDLVDKLIISAQSMFSGEKTTEMFGTIMKNVLKISVPFCRNVIIVTSSIVVCFISAVYMSVSLDKVRKWRKVTIFSEETAAVVSKLKILVNVYFKIEILIMIINSILCAVTLFIIKNPYALLLGIIIGLVDALPIFGTGTILIPWSVVMLLLKNYEVAVLLFVLYIVTYFVREIMESKCMGDRIGIAPFTMLAVIFVGIMVYGIVGFITGPVSYVIIKALISYLKSIIEHDKL